MAMAGNLAGSQLCSCSSGGVGVRSLPLASHKRSVSCASPSRRGAPLRSSSRNVRERGGGLPRLRVVVSASSSSGGGPANQEKQREEKRSSPATAPVPPTTASSAAVEAEQEEDQVGGFDRESLDNELAAIYGSEDEITRAQTESDEGSSERRDGSGSSSGSGSARTESADDIGKALTELRKARAAAVTQDPAATTNFWKGVVEETRLIEWPAFSKILGTTGVVIAMILGSSVVLLTVNGILSASSDYLFNDPGFQSFAKTYLNLAF